MTSKAKFQLEFVVKASPALLYSYISTPSGLEQWFADNVKSRGEEFTFIWENAEEEAKLLAKKTNQSVKFKWNEDDEEEEEEDYLVEFILSLSLSPPTLSS